MAAIGVSEIGLMSFSIDTVGLVFGNGIPLAIFHSIGSTPSLSELLNIAVNGGARTFAKFLITHGGMLSGPVSFLALTLSMALKVVHKLITY